jgi:hypothetical protein
MTEGHAVAADVIAHWNRDGSRASGLGGGGHVHGFWSKVLKRPDGCWVWLGYLDKNGAGKFCTMVAGKRITVRAAVYAWRELVGEIPAKHSLIAVVCWNARCVNPAHRICVPHRDLSRWFHALGRPYEHADNRGELCGRARLREEDVLFIRVQPTAYGLVPLLARLYQVSPITIQQVRYGRTWKHLGRRRAPVTEILSLKSLRELVEARESERAGLQLEKDRFATARPGAAA